MCISYGVNAPVSLCKTKCTFLSYQRAFNFTTHIFKTISGNEFEKLLKNAILIHCRISYAQIKDFRHL